jgi:hypothetical protein
MIEILALVFLTRNIGNLAEQKGLKPGIWKLYTVLAWIGAEIAGILIGFMLLGTENVVPAILMGIAAAISSYFIIKSTLEKQPDLLEDDINELGQPQE